MPSEKIRVPFPIKGLDTSTQLDAQPPGTTRDARNVRGICPRTGRNRGAQRAPLEKYTTDTGPGYKTQALAVVSYDQARNKYTQLNNEPNVDVSPTDVASGLEWAKSPVEGELYSVVTDLNGNVYTLSADRMIYKHSADGELLDTLSIVGYTSEEVVRRIQVDALGSVYAATSTTDNSTLYRFEPDEDVGYVTRYRWKSTDKMIDFQLKFGQIYHVSEKSHGPYRSYVAILYNLDSDIGPYTIFERPVPTPVSGIAVGENGSIYVTCPKNLNRNSTPDSEEFGPGVISWTPHELDPEVPAGSEYATEWGGYKRIHAWLDGRYLSGIHGSDVSTWIDSKQKATKAESLSNSFEEVADTVDRTANNLLPRFKYASFGTRPFARKNPTLFSGGSTEEGGFGAGKICLEFNGDDTHQVGPTEGSDQYWYGVGDYPNTGQSLYWETNDGSQNRTLATGTNDNSAGLVPGLEDVVYTTFFVVRIPSSQDSLPRGLFGLRYNNLPSSQKDEQYVWRLIFNANTGDDPNVTDGPPWSGRGGSLMLTGNIWDHSGSTSGDGDPSSGSRYWGIKDGAHARLGSSTPSDSEELVFPSVYDPDEQSFDPDAPGNTFVIAVHHGGKGEINKSLFRVNGRQVGDQFTFKADKRDAADDSTGLVMSQSLGSANGVWEAAASSEVGEVYQDDYLLHGGLSSGSSTNSFGFQAALTEPTSDIFGFSGWIAEVITVLGTTSVTPNDTVPTNHVNYSDGVGDGNTEANGDITEVEKIEGYLAWKWGVEKTLAPSHPFVDTPPPTTVEDGSDGTDPGEAFSDEQKALMSTDPILVKYNGNNGDLVWAMSAAGLGHSVVADDKNQIITFGQTVDPGTSEDPNPFAKNPTTGTPEPNATMRKIIDLGETFVADDVGDRTAWTINNDTIPENAYAYPQMFLDQSGDVYVPSDPDQEKMLGGGGVYKVNVSDGSVDFHIPSPVNYFMEGEDQSATGISTGIGADDWSKLPWQTNYANSPEAVEYMEVRSNVAKHPITGEMTVATVFDRPCPMPNPTWSADRITSGEAAADGDLTEDDDCEAHGGDHSFKHEFPKYRNLLYSADTEASLAATPSFNVVQHIDNFMPANELGTDEGWIISGVGGHTDARDRAFINAPDLSQPYNASGKYGGPLLLSTTATGHVRRETLGTGTNDRIKDNTTYCFSVWIQRNPLDAHTGSARTHDYARVDLKHNGSTYRNSYVVIDLNTGLLTATHFSHGGGDDTTLGAATWGVDSFTAAKDWGSTETVIWDRVFVTMPYDATWDSSSDLGLSARIHPAIEQTGTGGQDPPKKGAIHVWGPMLIEGTTPVSHNYPSWISNMPYPVTGQAEEVNQAWATRIWLDGDDDGVPQKGADRTGVHSTFLSHDTVTPKALAVGDEVFFSCYVAKFVAFQEPTDANPNPASVSYRYGNVNFAPWMSSYLKDKNGSNLEYFTWHLNTKTGDVWVRDFVDDDEGSGVQASEANPDPYGNAVVSEDAGDYWRIGCWLKYFGVQAGGNTCDIFQFEIHNSGSTDNLFTYGGRYYFSGAEIYINSGVHPGAPGGLQFPTPNLGPNAPNAGSCLSIAPPFKSVEVDETGLNDDSEFEAKQKSPEFIYFTQRGNEPTLYDKMIRKHRIVAATPILGESQSPRANKLISVNNGSLYTVNTPGEEGDSYAAIEGGDSVLAADLAQIQWTQHQGKLYFVDGNRVVVYDPVLGTVEDLESKKSGEVPDKPRLIASWRNRLVLARTIDEPHNWHMSAIGDPENWDYFPALPVVTQAVSGNNARAGLASDLINTLIPYNDDLMIMGGDHSIARMTGDPMAGGQIDIVSQTIGMAFGTSWTMIPDGTLFFVSTEGRIFAMSPNGQIEKISNKYVENAVLEHWSSTEHQIKLLWNNKDDGLHVLFLPVGLDNAGPANNALFWERVNNAWWRDQFAAEVTPYSAIVRDGDQPQDRTVLFGTSDGTVLNWAKQNTDSTTISDYNDNSIDAWVFMDVASPTLSGAGQMRVTSVSTVMSNYTENTKLQLCSADDPMSLRSNVVGEADIGPGTSGRIPLRAKGSNIGLFIQAHSPDAAFSMERLQLTITPTGRAGWLGGHEDHGHPE
jgi:hypothetical protein